MKAFAASKPVSLEVVIPLYNEEKVVSVLIETLKTVFASESLKDHGVSSIHYLMIDDGSRDDTAKIIQDEIKKGFSATLYRLSRNFGHQGAVSAGLDYVTADLVAVMDADLQDPPALIFDMIEKWRQGYQVIYGQRKNRKESPVKKFCYWFFYRLLAILSDTHIPLDSGDFCLMDKKVIMALRKLPEKLRFPRGLRSWIGFNQVGLSYDRPSRQAGKTQYTIAKLYKLATDGIASTSTRPLKVAQLFSAMCFVLLLFLCAFLFWHKFFVKSSTFSTAQLLICILIVSGNLIQLLSLYILSAYIGRTYLEVKDRPPYLIMEVIGSSKLSEHE